MSQTRRITIFGGSGFIGSHLAHRLVADGWEVRIAVRNPARAGTSDRVGGTERITAIRADITGSDGEIEAAVAQADAVVNLVGILHERGRQTFRNVHVEGAGRLARIAAAAGATRFIHNSALGASAASESAYARSKAAGEDAVRAAFPAATIFRPSIVIGPGDHFFTRFAGMARYSPALPLIGGGRTKFEPVYVGDVVAAIVRALDDPAAQGKTYELTGPRTYSFAELMRLMFSVTGQRRFLVNIPFAAAELEATALEWLPTPPLTRDQVKLLKQDNVASPGAAGLSDLGLTATPIESVIPAYLGRARAA